MLKFSNFLCVYKKNDMDYVQLLYFHILTLNLELIKT